MVLCDPGGNQHWITPKMPGTPPPPSWGLDEPGGHPHPKLPNVSEPERLKSLNLHCCSLHSQVAGEQTLIRPPL